MKLTFICLLFICIATFPTLNLIGQAPVYDWGFGIGSDSFNYGRQIAVDDQGNVYTAGYFEDSLDCDPGPGNYVIAGGGIENMFLMKNDPSGNLLWARGWSCNCDFISEALTFDPTGDIVIAGIFNGNIDFDPGPGSHYAHSPGRLTGFILTLTPAGDFRRLFHFSGQNIQYIHDISFDRFRNVYITGGFWDTADFDPGAGTHLVTAVGDRDSYILSLDSVGDFRWVYTIGSPGFDRGRNILVSSDGTVYATGNVEDSVSFDPASPAQVYHPVSYSANYVVKLGANGQYEWVRIIDGPHPWGLAFTRDLEFDYFGNLLIAGTFVRDVDFDPGPNSQVLTSAGFNDGYVQCLDTAGSLQWTHQLGGLDNDQLYGLDVDAAGQIYLSGIFRRQVNFNTTSGPQVLDAGYTSDDFVQILNSSGTPLYASQIRHQNSSLGNDIAVDAFNGIFLVGGYRTGVDLDPGPDSVMLHASNHDIFLLRLSTCLQRQTDSILSCGPLTWIDGQTYTTSNDSALITFQNQAGCDSIVHLYLVIEQPDPAIFQNGGQLQGISQNVSYQWLDCTNGMQVIPGATDSIFMPANSGQYALAVYSENCGDTSGCLGITLLGSDVGRPTSVRISPNPNLGRFCVDFGEENASAEIQIWDLTGRVLFAGQYENTESGTVNVNLSAGIYLIRVKTDGREAVQRLVVE